MEKKERKKKLLVCDVEGTIFKANFRIQGTEYASTMWQPLAHQLDSYNIENGSVEKANTVAEEEKSHQEWNKQKEGKYSGIYLNWVEDTVRIHKEHGMCKKVFDTVLKSAVFNTGVEDFFMQLDEMDSDVEYIPVLISGGFIELIERAQRELISADGKPFIKHGFGACKYLWDEDGHLTAWSLQPSDFEDKYSFLKIIMQQYGLNEATDWIFVGDGENDTDIASRAPLSFAINPHVKLAAVATYTIDSFMEIAELLKNDAASRYLSTKRGLSNTQAITVGQRMLNNGNTLSPISLKDYLLDKVSVKYLLDVNISKDKCNGDEVFKSVLESVIKWAKEIYADDDKKYDEVFAPLHESTDSFYNLLYNETAKIFCSYISNDEGIRCGFYISAPDLGTVFRQPIFGAKVDFNILLTKCKDKDDVNLKLNVIMRLPNNYPSNISTESFCPPFIKYLVTSDDSFCLRTTGEGKMLLSSKFKQLNISLSDINIEFPVVLVDESFKEDLKELPTYLFGFAKVFTCKDISNLKYISKNTYAVVYFPDDNGEPSKKYDNASFDNPTPNIGYDIVEKHHIVYSVADGKKNEALIANITDYVMENYKQRVENLTPQKSYYDEVLEAVNITVQEKSIIESRQKTAKNLIDKSEETVSNLTWLKIIEKAQGKAICIIDSQAANLKLSKIKSDNLYLHFYGVKEMLEKGELVLNALQGVHDTQQYPISILQPIANSVEICVNIYLLLANKGDFLTDKFVKHNTEKYDIYNKGLGSLIGYLNYNIKLENKSTLIEKLERANEIRIQSAHPNSATAIMSDIIVMKNEIYEALDLISKEMEKYVKTSDK